MATLEADQLVPGHSIVRSLSAGPNGAVLLAKQVEAGREVLVKTFRPAVLLDGEAERAVRRRRVQAFLTVARVQQDLSASAKHWAPVHAFGPLSDGDSVADDGAFYTTDEYPASAAWLIRGHVPLTSATLGKVVAGVIAALAEMRECCNRGHGNLTPGNVLLSDRDPRSARVLLTDPLPELPGATAASAADAEAADEADDRWAVGALIYGLVTHKVVRRTTLLPETPDADWATLGRDAGRWLSLCTRLMARVPAERPDLATVLDELGVSDGPSNAGRVLRWAAVGVAVAAAAAAAGLGAYVHLYHKAIANLGDIDKPWVKSLIDLNDKDGPLLASDPSFSRDGLPAKLNQLAGTGHIGSAGGQWVPSYAAFQTARSAAGTLAVIRQALTADHWALLANVQVLQAQARQNGWTTAVADLQKLTASLPPDGGDRSGQGLRDFLARAPLRLKRGGDQELGTDWKDFTGGSNDLAAAAKTVDDPAAKIAAALRQHLAETVRLDVTDDESGVIKQNLESATVICHGLATFVASVDRQDDYEKWRESVRGLYNPAPVGGRAPDAPADVEQWLAQLESHVGLALDGRPSVNRMADALRTDGGLLAQVRPDDQGLRDLRAAYDAQAKQAQSIHARARTWTQADAATVDDQCDAITGTLRALAGRLTAAATFDRWLAEVTAQARAVPSVASAVAGFTADEPRLAADADLRHRRQASVQAWVEKLQQLDADTAQAAATISATFGKAAGDRYRHEMWAAPLVVNLDEPPADVQVARLTPSPWVTTFERFRDDLPLRKPWTDLSVTDAIGSRWVGPQAPPDDATFVQLNVQAPGGSLAGSPVVVRDVAHLDVLARTASMDRAARTAACGASTTPAIVALATRLRLDALASTDPWPRTEQELRAADLWYRTVAPAAASLRADGTPITDAQLVAWQQAAWARFVASAKTPGELAVAVPSSADFGVSGLDAAATLLAHQPPTAYYNLLVCMSQMPADQRAIDRRRFFTAVDNRLPPADQSAIQQALRSVRPGGLPPADRFYMALDPTWYRWPGPFKPVAVVPPPPPVITQPVNVAAVDGPPRSAQPGQAPAQAAAPTPPPRPRSHSDDDIIP